MRKNIEEKLFDQVFQYRSKNKLQIKQATVKPD